MTWPPLTEADVLSALDLGDVAESNTLDMKALVGDSSSARRETAKDLASFAVDGGALLIGVVEDKEARTFKGQPIDLHDVIERIEQIAANRVDPPLMVRPREIPSTESGRGYVWVDIPESPDAPHMVDGRYYGRGVRTNRILTDADVLRLHRQRRDDQGHLLQAIEDLRARDPFPGARRGGDERQRPQTKYGHLYLVATPRRAATRIAQSFVWEREPQMLEFKRSVERGLPPAVRNNAGLSQYVLPEERSSALVLTNFRGLDQIGLEGNEGPGFDLRISADGTVGITVTRVSTSGERDGSPRLLDNVLLAGAWRLLGWAKVIAEATGYSGTWDVGLQANKLLGRSSIVFADPRRFDGGRLYDEDQYERAAIATFQDLDAPARVVRALTEPLLRGLGTWEHWTADLPDLL